MKENVEEHDRMLIEFEKMFMFIKGDLDFGSLKTNEERELEEQ